MLPCLVVPPPSPPLRTAAAVATAGDDVDDDDDDARAYRGVTESARRSRSRDRRTQIVAGSRQAFPSLPPPPLVPSCACGVAFAAFARIARSPRYGPVHLDAVGTPCREGGSETEKERERKRERERQTETEREREREKEGDRSALATSREGSSCTTFPSVTFVSRPIRIARRRPDRCPVDGFNPVTVRPCCAFVVSASCDCFHGVLSSPR